MKLADFSKRILMLIILILVYIGTNLIEYHTNYYSITTVVEAEVIDRYPNIKDMNLFGNRYKYLLEIRYNDATFGLVGINKHLYYDIKVGDRIFVKIIDTYSKADNCNVESIILFDHF